ncbi:hypothetical protein [Pseudohalioglobus lutimaris]|uniref:Type II secretion system protein GspC N-terminal domain-containing protein n=1 Tax=Pseudohalioglobus lutimaris TaxID=1737061 RepID=A0A2N5X7E8_9GAMM|nr:hypothetical protein [Pseudohalioglobus lutimaris]PLW70413.1 hypothetical protein C0039_04225 [Pseudohalioglobus lutimaris]
MSFLQRYQRQLDPLRSERRVELVVLVLLALLVLQLIWGAYRSVFPSVPAPVQPTAEALEIQSLRSTPPITPELRNEIRERPLFWISRRPHYTAAPAEAAAIADAKAEQRQAAKIAGLELAGVFGAGETAGIIVLAKEKNKQHRVTINQAVNGWTLESVSPTEAVLSSNGRQATLALQRGGSWAAQGSTAPAPAPEAAAQPAESPGAVASGKDSGSGKKKNPGNGKPRAKASAGEDSLSLGRGSR